MRGNVARATGMTSLLLFFSSMPICQAQVDLGEPKVSRFDFYLHDFLVARKPTAVTVAKANTINASPTLFGEIVVIDDPLTEGPELTSKVIDGKFKGSTLTKLGRNPVLHKVRELSIIGGSGAFRLACGYVIKQTYSVDLTTQNAVVHYNVTVLHYKGIFISISFFNDSMTGENFLVVLTMLFHFEAKPLFESAMLL
ncbi:hypothetical protein AMTRI_Chr09g41270 [Amborella trichopoda]